MYRPAVPVVKNLETFGLDNKTECMILYSKWVLQHSPFWIDILEVFPTSFVDSELEQATSRGQ
jgi:hypothetical protein